MSLRASRELLAQSAVDIGVCALNGIILSLWKSQQYFSNTQRSEPHSRGFMSRPGTLSNKKTQQLQKFWHTDEKIWWCVYSFHSVQHICTMCLFINELLVKSWCLSWTALYWELFLIWAPVLIHNHELGGILETPVVQRQLQLEPHCSDMLTPLWQCEQKQLNIKVQAHVLDCIRLYKCS